jgi:hypothetical protein
VLRMACRRVFSSGVTSVLDCVHFFMFCKLEYKIAGADSAPNLTWGDVGSVGTARKEYLESVGKSTQN